MNIIKFIVIASSTLVFFEVNFTHASVESPGEPINSLANEAGKVQPVSKDADKELFKRLFSKKRKEQIESVKQLQKMDSYEYQYKLVMMMFETSFKVIETNKAYLEKVHYDPSISAFPEGIKVKDALASVLENSALLGDTVLHLPDISHRILKKQTQWHSQMHWSLNFLNQSKQLLDKSTNTMIHLARQELHIEPRETGYFNPHWIHNGTKSNDMKNKHSKKKEKYKKEQKKKKFEL